MSVNCSQLTSPVEFLIEDSMPFITGTQHIIVCDTSGEELFCCDISQNTSGLGMKVVNVSGIWKLVVGKPDDLGLDPQHEVTLDCEEMGAEAVFEKLQQDTDLDFIGFHDMRYNGIIGPSGNPFNGYKRYRFSLSVCPIVLKRDNDILTIKYTDNSNGGVRITNALVP